MQDSFPVLTNLWLDLYSDDEIGETAVVIPDSFLGGSAPCLRDLTGLTFCGISFPGLPKLLLSATYLLSLQHWRIPHSAYSISHQRQWSPASLP